MPYHILIADDATMNRSLIKNILSKSLVGAEFSEAINGEEVLAAVQYSQIDLIILDLIMPVMDGFQTLKWLKKHPEFHDIPVIVNSAITEIKSIEETLKEGAVDYFTKPLSPNDMEIILPLKAKNALLLYEQQRTIIALNRQISEELKNANTFANIMLPKEGGFRRVDLFMKYHPSLGVGGDFFDCVELDGRIHFMVADVTGHGIAAGMAASMVKVLYRKTIEKEGILPSEILHDMNCTIFEMFDFAGKDNYLVFTAFVGIIDGETLYYANAGQPYPLIYRDTSKSFHEVKENGFLVGILNHIHYETRQTDFRKGDMVFLYTDGLFCAGEGNDFTGWEKVCMMSKHFDHVAGENPKEFLEELFYAFYMFHKASKLDFTDDVAMMLIRKK